MLKCRIEAEIIEKHAKASKKRCVICVSAAKLQMDRAYQLRCTWRACRKSLFIFYNMPFEGTRLSVEIVCEIIKIWREKIEITSISAMLEINRKSVEKVIEKLHSGLEESYDNTPSVIGEPGIIVEIDESKFGKFKYNRGHKVDVVWAFGIVERTPERRIVLVKVDDRKRVPLTRY